MLERAIITLIVLIAGGVVLKAFVRALLSRVRARVENDPLLDNLRPDTPTIVYFTSPACLPCRTQQQPALARVQQELGEAVQIVRVDAIQNPDAADRWGVFSVPTTFILDSARKPHQVNYGVADADKLKRQLQAVGLNPLMWDETPFKPAQPVS